MRMSLEPRWVIVITFFTAGIFLGGLAVYIWLNLNISQDVQKINSNRSNYKYINPLLAVDTGEKKQYIVNTALNLQYQGLIQSAENNGYVNNISIYFRDLDPGFWLGLNEEAKFSPGNLLKIPLMIAYLKQAEYQPDLLNHVLVYKPPDNASINTESSQQLLPGRSYSVDELLKYMIVYSDNNAAILLYDTIDKKYLNEIFSDLGVDYAEDKTAPDFISVKSYALFFRVLYNATYLNREMSEKALNLLSQAPGDEGIMADLPPTVTAAHALGSRSYSDNSQKLYELRDCGIIYYPGHPYLLCVMTQGKDLNQALELFKNIGSVTYENMKNKYK